MRATGSIGSTAWPAVILLLAQFTSVGQGTVDFLNNNGTQIYTNDGAISRGPTEPVAEKYYYGLFITAPGTTVPTAFSFTGIYATNQAAPGRLLSAPVPAPVPGWSPNATQAYLVRGWSSNLGHDWAVVQQQLNAQQWISSGFYGESAIATGTAGGDVGANSYPALGIFGGATGLAGFDLFLVGGPPALAIFRSGPNVILTWPASITGFTLQSTPNLAALIWSTVSPSPSVVNGQNVVTNAISDAQMLYRLMK